MLISCLVNPLNAELNPICHLLAILEGATTVDVSGLRVKRTDEPTALNNLLLGTLMLFCSTLSRLNIHLNYCTLTLSFVTSCRAACLLSAHTPARCDNNGVRECLSDKIMNLYLNIYFLPRRVYTRYPI